MIADVNIPMDIVSPFGTLDLNNPDSSDGWFIVDHEEFEVGPSVRAQVEDVPQADGSIRHRRWLTGVTMTIPLLLMQDDTEGACDTLLVSMHDLLMKHARSLLRAGDNQGRIRWTPPGEDRRMLDDVLLLEYPRTSAQGGIYQVKFRVDTQFPYAIDLTETQQTIDSATATITMGGTAELWPVIKVHGPINTFRIANNSYLDELGNALAIVYDGTRPGAVGIGSGEYAEINTFRNTIYLNGYETNLKPGISPGESDYFPLRVGANSITTDCEAEFLLNTAWG